MFRQSIQNVSLGFRTAAFMRPIFVPTFTFQSSQLCVRKLHSTDNENDMKKTRVEASKPKDNSGYLYSDFQGELPRIMGKHNRIVHTLFEKTKSNRSVEAIEQDMNTLLNIVKLKMSFFKSLYRPELSSEENVKRVEEKLGKALELKPETIELLRHLASTKNLDAVPRVARSYLDIVRFIRGEMTATIISAEPLSNGQQQKTQTIFDAIAAMRNRKTVKVTFKVDPSIVGGLRLFLDDKEFYDFSALRDIESYEAQLN